MQIELGHTDLFSLEPVDGQNRKYSDKRPIFTEFIKVKNQEREEDGVDIDLNKSHDKFSSIDSEFENKNSKSWFLEYNLT